MPEPNRLILDHRLYHSLRKWLEGFEINVTCKQLLVKRYFRLLLVIFPEVYLLFTLLNILNTELLLTKMNFKQALTVFKTLLLGILQLF